MDDLEDIRREISNFLIDTSEDNPLICNIIIGESYGISDLERPTIISMFQIPGEGIICFNIEGYPDPLEFDDLEREDLIEILKYLYNND